MKKCKECGIGLTDKNWPAWRKKRRSYVCVECSRKHYRIIYKRDRKIRIERERIRRRKRKQKIVDAYGGKCVCCGEKIFEFLTIQHINNNGAEHKRQLGGTDAIHQWIVKNNFPKDITILCFNCNAASYYYGECPHRTTNHGV